MVPSPRIELGTRPYHGRVMPFNYEGLEAGLEAVLNEFVNPTIKEVHCK